MLVLLVALMAYTFYTDCFVYILAHRDTWWTDRHCCNCGQGNSDTTSQKWQLNEKQTCRNFTYYTINNGFILSKIPPEPGFCACKLWSAHTFRGLRCFYFTGIVLHLTNVVWHKYYDCCIQIIRPREQSFQKSWGTVVNEKHNVNIQPVLFNFRPLRA